MNNDEKDFILSIGGVGISRQGKDITCGFVTTWKSGLKTFTVTNKELFNECFTEQSIKNSFNVTEIIFE